MNKELITKKDIITELEIDSDDFENLMDTGSLPYYELKGEIGFEKSEINNFLNNKNKKLKPLIKIINNIFRSLSKIIPLFYSLGKLIEMSLKGLIGV
tara:strand:+ start:63 stop:353 length:291 start_codon:yes stop_codon:yes gene_type:complete